MVKNYKRKTCHLINIPVPTDNNVPVKEYNKITKYKDQEIKIEKLQYLKTITVPVIVVVLDTMKKMKVTHINKIPDSTLYGNGHLLRRVLSMLSKNITQKRQQRV